MELQFQLVRGGGAPGSGGGGGGGDCARLAGCTKHILGKQTEPLDEESQEPAGRVVISLPMCLCNVKGNHMLY